MSEMKIETKHGELLLDCDSYQKIKSNGFSIQVRMRKFRNALYPETHLVKWINGKRVRISMPRFILDLNDKTYMCDHIDRNSMNNLKSNLRIATKSQNQRNVAKFRKKCSSKYKGSCFDKKSKKFYSSIYANGRSKYLGRFDSEESAAIAYDLAAKQYFGEYACINFPEMTMDQLRSKVKSSL